MAKLQSSRKSKINQIKEKAKIINKKTKETTNIFKFIENKKPLYYSGFCLTDNLNFAFFYADDKKIIDNFQTKDLNKFKLNEADLDMIVDKTEKLEPEENGEEVIFKDVGFVYHDLFNTMKTLYPKCVFHKIQSFFGQDVNSMIIVLQEEFGKPVGLLKTK